MKKSKRSAEEILEIVADILSERPTTIFNLSKKASTPEKILTHSTIERYLGVICKVQELFNGKKIKFEKQKFGDKHYKVAWIEGK